MQFETDVVVSDLRRIPSADAYEFRGRGGWLDRIRRWLWMRWAAPSGKIEYAYKRVHLSDEQFRSLIASAINKLGYRFRDIDRIIVGPSQLGYAVEEFHAAFSFVMPTADGDGHGQLHIYNIPIQMVPWFDGVLVVPKEK